MTKFHSLFENQIHNVPRIILEDLIEKKLSEVAAQSRLGLVSGIANHILSGSLESFKWNNGDLNDVKISPEFSNKDLADINQKVESITKLMPSIIENIASEISIDILNTLKENWQEEYQLQKNDCDGFRIRLEDRWGEATGLLRLLLTICREIGDKVPLDNSSEQSHRRNLLIRLHARACQVTSEIITLLENGFADGAMARWRTLHEINVVMTLIKEHDEDLAERYIAHRAIESKIAKDQYELCHEQLGFAPLSPANCAEIDVNYKKAIDQYGKQFGTPYGWAAKHVQPNNGRLGFGELEAAAGRASMGPYYKFASHNIHAGPHALYFRMGLMDDSVILAGASNSGLIEPGQNTAVSLTSVTFSLIGDRIDLDVLLYMKILLSVRDEIPDAFAKADLKLQQDHLQFNFTEAS